ncbi:hypothetical protein LCGC14_2826290, partial [marine sediment metagenome]
GFDWVDFVAATGYVIFDGVNAINSTGSNYMLIDAQAASGAFGNDNRAGSGAKTTPFITVTQGGGAGPTKSMDLDFDATQFQLPRTIEGDAFVGLTLGGDDGSSTGGAFIIAKLRKWDGSSETDIASVQSETLTLTLNKETSYALKIVVPRTHFKQGEQIRLTIEFWSTGTQFTALFHLPDNAAHTGGTSTAPGTVGNTRMSVAIPFKLDFM